MKKAEKSAKTITSKTNKNANPQVSKKTNKTNKEVTDEVKATSVKVESKNAQFSPIAEEFEKFKKRIESEIVPSLGIEDCEIPNVNGMELLGDGIDEIPKLIDPIFHRVGLASLIGSSDTGKSAMLRELCVCVVTGRDFLGWKVEPIHKRAYYVSTEDDKMAISYLLKKQNEVYGLKPEDLENLVYIFETDNLLARLHNELSQKPADIVIIDTFTDIFNGQLYETNRVRSFLNDYSQLAQKYGCLVIFLHHTNKRSDNLEPSKHNALGSQGFEAKMRLMIELKSDTQINNKKHFCIVKGNYLSHQFKTHSFELQFTENLTFTNLNTRTHYDLITQNKERRETIEYEYNEITKLKEQGLTHEEIGNEMGISKSSVSKKISRYNKLIALENSNNK
ncbi:MAG: hypothetical protein H6Q16_2114 [Bacteroidetes bacterium]|nr:hypothetical protein [Bacteroidota bacterium]